MDTIWGIDYGIYISSFDVTSQELTLTDDTVLEEHYEDPRLLQIKLLGEGGIALGCRKLTSSP